MLTWIVDFLKSIGSLILTVFVLIIQTFTSMFQLIQLIPSYLTYITSWLSSLPDFIFVFAVVIPLICIIWGIKKAVSV